MGDQSAITFSPQDIDQPQQNGVATPISGAAPITFAASDIDRTTAPSSVTMVGSDGTKQQVAPSDVATMRQKNFALTADNPNAQKMATADGKIAYVLPSEVSSFEDNGATHILPDGRFNVKDLRSDNSEFPDSVPDVRTRAINVIKALGPEETHKAIQAEQKYWTSKEGLKEEAKGLGNAALVGGGTMAALAAPGPAIQGAKAAVPVVGQFARQVGQEVVKHYAGQSAAKVTADLLIKGAGAVGLGWLAKLGFGK